MSGIIATQPTIVDLKERTTIRIIEIIEARIAYNKALQDYLYTTQPQEAKDYLSRLGADFRNIFDRSADEQLINSIKEQYIRAISTDLAILAKTKEYIQEILKDDSEINLLKALINLHYQIEYEQYNLENHRAASVRRSIKLAREARNYAKQHASSAKSHKAVLKAADKAARLAEEKEYLEKSMRSEISLYKEILELLMDNNVVGKMGRALIADGHLEINFVNDDYTLKLATTFTKRSIANGFLRIKELVTILTTLKCANKDWFAGMIQEITDLHTQLTKITTGQVENFRHLATIYKFLYQLPTTLADFESRLNIEFKEEQQWAQEQTAKIEKEQLRVHELATKAANDELQLSIELNIAEGEKLKLLALEQINKKMLEDANQKSQAEKFAAAMALRKETLIMRKNAIESTRIKNEVARRKSRLTAIQSLPKVTTTENGKIKSTFKLQETTIQENAAALLHLFNSNITAQKYREICKLIKDLGGKIDKASGSSHQRIIFNECVYRDIEHDEIEPTTPPNSIKKGFARKSEISAFNLKLVREAISCMLPDDWQQRYSIKKKPPQIS